MNPHGFVVFGFPVTWAMVALVLASQVIPYISGLLTKYPGWWTAAATLVLSAADAFFGLWAQQGDAFNVRDALLATLAVSFLAFFHHKQFIDATKVQEWLHAHGNSLATGQGTGRPAQQPPPR